MTEAEKKYLAYLQSIGFEGDITQDRASLLVAANDNSIYQLEPIAVIFPKNIENLVNVIKFSAKFNVAITVRGGCTGTNGQSLNSTIIVDVSKYLTNITDFDEELEQVTVEPGVILNQLNQFLATKGYFFPVAVSSGWAATLGGMFATDACGQGSKKYGKTSNQTISANFILQDGSLLNTKEPESHSSICHQIKQEINNNIEQINKVFPKINRSLTGYNLKEAINGDNQLNLVKLLAGSEGTLAITSSLTLNIKKIPNFQGLVVLGFAEFEQALLALQELENLKAIAIELLDDKVVKLAQQSYLKESLQTVFNSDNQSKQKIKSYLFIQFFSNRQSQINLLLEQSKNLQKKIKAISFLQTQETRKIQQIWLVRKLAAGLLASPKDNKSGWAFVEDVSVHPNHILPFVKEFREILDSHQLQYGMYGHADVGCVHVRPMLDLTKESDRKRIRPISDQVAQLAKKYSGLMWGEHGKGIRGEYLEDFVGAKVYQSMRRIKTIFDPQNRFNPGKLTTPFTVQDKIYKIDEIAFRGEFDQDINTEKFAQFYPSIQCNGNGLCMNWEVKQTMCPSFKISQDRRQSPKGRAALFREWARLQSKEQPPTKEIEVLDKQIVENLKSCVSCQSCKTACPAQIDIAKMKTEFLSYYFTKNRRPTNHLMISSYEELANGLRKMPKISNAILQNKLSKKILSRYFSMVDLPTFSLPVEQILIDKKVQILNKDYKLNDKSVCLIIDTFNGYFETRIIRKTIELLQKLEFTVYASPLLKNGKANEIIGKLEFFKRVQQKLQPFLSMAKNKQIPLISLEPAQTELLRSNHSNIDIYSIEQFLNEQIITNIVEVKDSVKKQYQIFLHCTEKSINPESAKQWKNIFDRFSLDLQIKETGCCGMAGIYGHLKENQNQSTQLFNLTWQQPLEQNFQQSLVTGFSCRSQVHRLLKKQVKHPIEALLENL